MNLVNPSKIMNAELRMSSKIFPNGVTGKKCTAFFTARGVDTPIEWGLGKI